MAARKKKTETAKAEPKKEAKPKAEELTALVNIPASMSPTGLRIDRGQTFEADASKAKHFKSIKYAE